MKNRHYALQANLALIFLVLVGLYGYYYKQLTITLSTLGFIVILSVYMLFNRFIRSKIDPTAGVFSKYIKYGIMVIIVAIVVAPFVIGK